MNPARVFIDRPITAGVLSILIFLVGAIAMTQLPVSEYPEVVPPQIVVVASYPGANPRVIAETVAAPLEEEINGVEGMLYMSSQATADGLLTLTVTFAIGTDTDIAETAVQNRVNRALPRLPAAVRQIGVSTTRSSPNLTMVVHLVSPDGRYDELYLRNYAVLNVRDRLQRIPGMGRVQVFGSGDYAMRIWIDPLKLASRNLTANDVVSAIREQNVQVAAGVIGAPPGATGAQFQLAVDTRGRLESEADFEDVIVATSAGGQVVRVRDIGRVELGADQYALRSLLDNRPAIALAIFQSPDANALRLSSEVRAVMDELARSFPQGLEYSIVYDPTRFVEASIESVVKTLLEAVLLVVIVVVVFLQTWRASLIPLLAVPVSIVGTFAVLLLLGYSINTLTLFGLVLSIGIVVDDAIVVVENVERNISNGMAPHAATRQAMREVSGPIIAIALVLTAVFVPLAFVSGLSGQFYRQFAVTIAISTLISAFNSLTLSPALCAVLLRGHDQPRDWLTRVLDALLGWFFRGFNAVFRRGSQGYQRVVSGSLRVKTLVVLIYLGLLGATWHMFERVPTGFVPQQDKQYLVGFAQLPEGASLDRTEAVIRRMSALIMDTPGVAHAVAFPGLSISGFTNAPNAGIVFVTLEDFARRTGPELSAGAIAGAINQRLFSITDAFIAVFPPPPVEGLGTVGGFKLQLQDRRSQGFEELERVTEQVLAEARQRPELAGLFTGYQINVPQLEAVVDRTKAKQLGIDLGQLYETLQVSLGSLYVNDFNRFGRTYRVVVQADAPYRSQPEDIGLLETRSGAGRMVPLSSLLSVQPAYGPDRVMRYNGFLTADINGGPAPGYSSGQAQAAMEQVVRAQLPPGFDFEWTDLVYQEIIAGDTMMFIFPLCVFLVFLVLAAQYESWSLPLAVILIVPMCILSALLGLASRGMDNNMFTQIAFVVLVGLACKNSILIVEFARSLQSAGRDMRSAVLEACRLRLRPILMTSVAFIAGVYPLVISSGAGAEMRQAIGVAVFSGMLGVTVFGLLLTPVFYALVRRERAARGPAAD